MASAPLNPQAPSTDHKYQALLAVSEAIVSHRELSALFHELAGRLHQVVRFDYLGLALHETTSNTLRIHLLEGTEPIPLPSPPVLPLEEEPAGWVWQTQQAWIFSNVPEEKRWPRALERAKRYGVQSSCHLPLTTARRRLGILVFACKQPYAYETADVSYLQLVANQVAVSVENALAFQEIEALKDQLSKANAYLEEEVRTEHNFGEIIGDSAALHRVLHEVETVAATGSTVLIRGETGTGKELVARAVHDLSPRQGRTFVKLNCAAIPTGLLDFTRIDSRYHYLLFISQAETERILRTAVEKQGVRIERGVELVGLAQDVLSHDPNPVKVVLRYADGRLEQT